MFLTELDGFIVAHTRNLLITRGNQNSGGNSPALQITIYTIDEV